MADRRLSATRRSQGSSRRGFLERLGGAVIALAGAAQPSPRPCCPTRRRRTRTSAATPTRPATARRRPGCRGSTAAAIRCARATACRSTTSGGRSTPKGQPVDAHGHVADATPTGCRCAPAPRTKTCETAGDDYGIKLSARRLVVSLLRRHACGASATAAATTNVRVNGDAALVGYCYPGHHVFCVTYFETVDAVLSGLAIAGALTALVAGIAGAWSPCGFSMVDTIGTALGDARRGDHGRSRRRRSRSARSSAASITFGGLALLGGARSAHGSPGAARRARRRARARGRVRGLARLADRAADPPPGARALALDHAAAARVRASTGCCSASASRRSCSTLRRLGAGRRSASPRPASTVGDRRRRRLRHRPRAAGRCGSRRGCGTPAGERGARAARARAAAVARHAAPRRARARRLRRAARQLERARGVRSELRDRPLRRRRPRSPGSASAAPASCSEPSVRRALPGTLPAVGGGNLAWVTRRGIAIARGLRPPQRDDPAARRTRDVDALAISAGWLVVRDVRRGRHREPLRASRSADLDSRATSPARRPPGRSAARRSRAADVAYSYSTPRSRAGSTRSTSRRARDRSCASRAQRPVRRTRRSHGGRLLYERTDRCAQQL